MPRNIAVLGCLVGLAVVCLAVSSLAGPKGALEDETHPRSPGTPLKMDFLRYECATCRDKGLLTEGEFKSFKMFRMETAALAKELDLDKEHYFIQTPHFLIVSTLRRSKLKFKGNRFARADITRLQKIFPKLKMGRDGTRINGHQRAHLYHIRAERWYAHFAALTDNKRPFLGMHERYHVCLFDDYAEHHTLNDKFIGRASDKAGVQHHIRDEPNFMVFTTSEQQVARDQGKGDTIFQNHVCHNIAHNLCDGHGNYYTETPAWIEEGIGHYYERRENTRHNTFCWSEGSAPRDFLKPKWSSVVYGIVRRKKDPSLSRWCEKLQPGELSGTQNGLSWSIAQYMVEAEPIRFTKLLRKLDERHKKGAGAKAKQDRCAKAIEHAFGVSPSVLHERWRTWVLEKYRK